MHENVYLSNIEAKSDYPSILASLAIINPGLITEIRQGIFSINGYENDVTLFRIDIDNNLERIKAVFCELIDKCWESYIVQQRMN